MHAIDVGTHRTGGNSSDKYDNRAHRQRGAIASPLSRALPATDSDTARHGGRPAMPSLDQIPTTLWMQEYSVSHLKGLKM